MTTNHTNIRKSFRALAKPREKRTSLIIKIEPLHDHGRLAFNAELRVTRPIHFLTFGATVKRDATTRATM